MADRGGFDLDLTRFEDWGRYCESVADLPRDHVIAGGGWIVSASTPPPTSEDPLARIPLERAAERREQAERTGDPGEGSDLLRTALEWLDQLHPRSSKAVRDLAAAERRRVEDLLRGRRR